MSKEEKKAIELMEICMFGTEELTIIKNIIDKQQKKIKKQRQKIKELKEEISDLKWKYSKF